MGRPVIVVLAGIATVILIASEIFAIAPTRDARRLRAVTRWFAVPALVIFAVLWLVRLLELFTQSP